jgi:2-polyprenyl-3-methyl-5-hydroxy-6-metoxy-1,4-benzoquinol methylase
MKNSFNGWDKVSSFDLNKVVDLVLTNGTVDTIIPDMWLLDYIGNKEEQLRILDFGSGVGRNIFQFTVSRPNWTFVGYDNDNMINKSIEYIRYKSNTENQQCIEFQSNWETLKTQKFDCIYATIVFQHIYELDLSIYLQDIKKMTNRMVVSGRRFNDDMEDGIYKNTWKILENNGFYPCDSINVEYDSQGDMNEHMTCIYKW